MEAKKKIQMIQEYGKWELDIPFALFPANAFIQEIWKKYVGLCPPRGRHQGGSRCAGMTLRKYKWKKVGDTESCIKTQCSLTEAELGRKEKGG